ncbi:hypothetical protein [Pseudomonas sp. EA_35y_Pfl2_R5]|uniref:hypothetical protein n=1 Tax=Pseudomonas sp. EA_35y_Pfl2_R5 TaxID=3088690 RepID=UPI0030D95D00
MPKKHMFLVRYSLNAQTHSVEVESEAEVLTPEQARFYIESLHTAKLPAQITQVQVSELKKSEHGAPVGRQLNP